MRADAMERFREKYEKRPDGCWIWTAHRNQGYGWFARGGGEGPNGAHRWIYEARVGPIPDDKEVHHICGNRACVNPEHLKLVDPARHKQIHNRESENIFWRNKQKAHCKHGHEFTEENTYYIPDGGGRVCRTCKRVAARKRYQRRKKRGLCTGCGSETERDSVLCGPCMRKKVSQRRQRIEGREEAPLEK